MHIAPDRAFWILDFYRRHGTRLHLAATISGEDAAASVIITDVTPPLHSINVRLFDDAGDRWWDRQLPIPHARYFLSQMGDGSSMASNKGRFHSALRLEFPDGTLLCFSEVSRRQDRSGVGDPRDSEIHPAGTCL